MPPSRYHSRSRGATLHSATSKWLTEFHQSSIGLRMVSKYSFYFRVLSAVTRKRFKIES